ncbi:MAG: hypothetical protein KAW16_06235, partial [candidate division Zixibacteria bacterium]|nr:hypothetical protein [candidate division Zixibacteria bacterium]
MKIGKSKSLIGLAVVLALLVGMTYLFLQVSGAQQAKTERALPSTSAILDEAPSVIATSPTPPEPPDKPPPPEHQLPSPVLIAPEIDREASKTVLYHRAYNFTPTASPKALLVQDFEEGIIPPTNWSVVVNNAYTWEIDSCDPYEGVYNASCFYDQDYTGTQDEWLISPVINLTTKGESWHLYFFWMMSYYWGVDPYDNYELEVWISTDGGANFT